MIRGVRVVLVSFLIAALPLQAAAFAMVQVSSAHPRHDASTHGHSHVHAHESAVHDEHAPPVGDPCDERDAGVLKCCHTHAAWLGNDTSIRIVPCRSFERRQFVARWTSFIPEEPSPPPIDLRAA